MKISLSRFVGRRIWLMSFALFSALGTTWAVASPLFSVPDEPAHAIYAAAAVRGQIWAETHGVETVVTVPADIASAPGRTCFAGHPEVPAGCAPQWVTRSGDERVITTVGHYPPAYYLYAGLPTLFVHGPAAVYLMRMMTVILVAALLASATCSALATRRPAFSLAGIGMAVTPMVFFFAGGVNPQAPEIGAAVLLWTSGYVLLSQLRSHPELRLSWRNAALRRCLAAVVVLTLARPLSLLWLALIVVTLLILLSDRASILALLRARIVRGMIPVIAVTAGSTVVWILVRHALTLIPSTWFVDLPLLPAAVTSLATIGVGTAQMVGDFGWLDTPNPDVITAIFIFSLTMLASATLWRARRRELLVLIGIGVGCLAIPTVLQLFTYRDFGFSWQGRYTLPLAVGIPILLGSMTGVTGEPGAKSRRVLLMIGAGFVTVQWASMMWALNRNIHGIGGFWGRSAAGWAPPLPVWFLALVMLGALVLAVMAVLRLPEGVPAHPGNRSGGEMDDVDSTRPVLEASGGAPGGRVKWDSEVPGTTLLRHREGDHRLTRPPTSAPRPRERSGR